MGGTWAEWGGYKAKTEAKRTKDQAAVANKDAAEVSKRQKLVDAVPIAAAAMAELASAHRGDWLKLSKDQLLACCLARGLPTSGNKPELSSRLSAAPQLLALMPPPLPPPPPPPPLPLMRRPPRRAWRRASAAKSRSWRARRATMRASPGPRARGLVGVELVGEGIDWQGRVATFSTF